jgi:hypothetical protein
VHNAGVRRLVLLSVLALVVAAPANAQQIATLRMRATVFRLPDGRNPTGRVVPRLTPLSHQRTSLPVLEQQGTWLRVLLPGRPNGHSGWIAARAARLWDDPWQVLVRTRSKRVFVLHDAHIVRSFPAVVGRSSSPTPHGHFYVEESLAIRYHSEGWPYAFALSARSNVYHEFAGGPGQVAIHGVYGIGGTPGTAESHGCVRMSSRALAWMARRIATGTPVDIVR